MKFWIFVIAVAVIGCVATTQKKPIYRSDTDNETEYEFYDEDDGDESVYGLDDRRPTPMNRVFQSLGFNNLLGAQQAWFNPCNYGIKRLGCGKKLVTLIRFQLLCRDSQGTVSEVSQMTPLASRTIRWTLAGAKGGAVMDRNGIGEIKIISSAPVTKNRVVLKNGTDILGVRGHSLNKLVVPNFWCR